MAIETQSNSSITSLVIGLVAGLGVSLVKLFSRRSDSLKKKEATVETAYLSALEQMRASWRADVEELRKEVDDLRTELNKTKDMLSQTILSRAKIQDDYEDLVREHAILKVEHEKVLGRLNKLECANVPTTETKQL